MSSHLPTPGYTPVIDPLLLNAEPIQPPVGAEQYPSIGPVGLSSTLSPIPPLPGSGSDAGYEKITHAQRNPHLPTIPPRKHTQYAKDQAKKRRRGKASAEGSAADATHQVLLAE